MTSTNSSYSLNVKNNHLFLLYSIGFMLRINDPTRISNSSLTCFDHIFIRNNGNVDMYCSFTTISLQCEEYENSIPSNELRYIQITNFLEQIFSFISRPWMYHNAIMQRMLSHCFRSLLDLDIKNSYVIRKINKRENLHNDWISAETINMYHKNMLLKIFPKSGTDIILKSQ